MPSRKTLSLTSLLFFLFHFLLTAQSGFTLPRSTPEMEGVSSEGINRFLEAWAQKKHEPHSFMMLRHGKVIVEGWWSPYRADLRHTMYSCSKSFTATAIGFAVTEKKLTVEDPVISFFPESLPDTISPYLAEMKVKHLLSMTVGQQPDPTGPVGTQHDDWVKAFLALPIVHQPGSRFLYNSLATYMLSAIVQKVTGEPIIDYLLPRLFEPLGITGADWESDPRGINTGGWGLRVKTEDMAKFGQLFLQKGQWNGKQILPASWVEEASGMKILQNPSATQALRDSSDWLQGYCYQMWRCRHNAYRGDGAFGQYIIVMPDHDVVIAITSETGDMQDEINLVWNHLLPSIQKNKLPAKAKAANALKQRMATLSLPLASKTLAPAWTKSISGKRFSLSPNDQYLSGLSLDFQPESCILGLVSQKDSFTFSFGSGKWIQGETKRLGPSLVSGIRGHFAGLPPSKIAGSHAWKNDSTLELSMRYIESPHSETWTCVFNGDKIKVETITSNNRNRIQYRGAISSNPIRLIVRGDDMGYSHSGNLALIQSSKGIQTSIEVIVPSPWFPEVVKMLEQNPGLDVGVHLAITSEWDNIKWRPVSDCPSIQDPDGYFYPMVFPNKNYPGQSIRENAWKIEDVEKEFRAQIELAMKKIPQISHISGHMGCSNLSDEVRAMTKRIAREYKLDVDLQALGVKYMSYSGPKKTPAEKIQSFINGLKQLEPGQTYLFVDHPGLDEEELRAIHHIGYEDVAEDRQGVTDLFTSPAVHAFIEKNGIKLISYADLAKEK